MDEEDVRRIVREELLNAFRTFKDEVRDWEGSLYESVGSTVDRLSDLLANDEPEQGYEGDAH